MRGQRGIEVPGISLDSFAQKFDLKGVDLLLMNIEGAEREALEGGRDLLARAKHVVICCHDFRADRGDGESMRTQGEVTQLLKTAGFRTYTRPNDPRPWVRCNVYGENAALLG